MPLPKINSTIALSILWLVLLSCNARAHDSQQTLAATFINAQSALTYRNDGLTSDMPWLIPGALLGGEALPANKGLTLDDLQVLGNYRVNNHYSVAAKLSAHGSGDDITLELENFWFTFNSHNIVANSLVEIGRISTDTTPSAYFHASSSPFSEASLLSDVFFGRHFNDMGIKAKTTRGIMTLGLEGWSGKHWPAANNAGAGSAFLHLQPSWQQGHARMGIWAMHSRAKNRTDTRYGNHSHGSVATITSPTSDIYFSGSSDLAGAFMSARQQYRAATFIAEAEWIESRSNGDLLQQTTNQQSAYTATYQGLRGLLGVTMARHAITVQYDQLALENVFLNSVNTVFLAATGLQNEGFNPSQLMAAYQWHYHRDFSLRLQWSQDDTTAKGKHNHTGIGLVWRKGLL